VNQGGKLGINQGCEDEVGAEVAKGDGDDVMI